MRKIALLLLCNAITTTSACRLDINTRNASTLSQITINASATASAKRSATPPLISSRNCRNSTRETLQHPFQVIITDFCPDDSSSQVTNALLLRETMAIFAGRCAVNRVKFFVRKAFSDHNNKRSFDSWRQRSSAQSELLHEHRHHQQLQRCSQCSDALPCLMMNWVEIVRNNTIFSESWRRALFATLCAPARLVEHTVARRAVTVSRQRKRSCFLLQHVSCAFVVVQNTSTIACSSGARCYNQSTCNAPGKYRNKCTDSKGKLGYGQCECSGESVSFM